MDHTQNPEYTRLRGIDLIAQWQTLEQSVVPISSVDLVVLCAADTGNTEAWTELLIRCGGTVKTSIRFALRQMHGFGDSQSHAPDHALPDLFQEVMLRLVENDCAVLKRFRGETDGELAGYLAIISRSVVVDVIRRENALKRPQSNSAIDMDAIAQRQSDTTWDREATVQDRRILASEITDKTSDLIKNERDRTIFRLYFIEGLSTAAIAADPHIGLSKAAVAKIVNQLKQLLVSALLSPGVGPR